MRFEIVNSRAFPLMMVELDTGESFAARRGALISMSEPVRIRTGFAGGLGLGLKRMLGGTELFVNHFEASDAGEVMLAPILPGQILHLPMDDEPVFVHSGAYLASSPHLRLDTQWKGSRTRFFGRQRDLRISGTGDLFLSAFGEFHEFHLRPGEKLSIDHNHLVAMEARLSFRVRTVGGRVTTLLSGESRITDFTGPGRVYVQTRTPQGFVAWLAPRLVR